uniref:CNNM transmembrane domain-containing protein n=1 Tax=Haemonchus placei TaxID=6290 RepID=A0A0N4WWU9_HAEPC
LCMDVSPLQALSALCLQTLGIHLGINCVVAIILVILFDGISTGPLLHGQRRILQRAVAELQLSKGEVELLVREELYH